MAAGIANLLIQQGETFKRTIIVNDNQAIPQPINLTGYTARSSIRTTADASTVTVAFTCTFDPVRTTGKIYLSLTDTQTSALPTVGKTDYSKLTKYTWDMEIIDATLNVTRLLNGTITVSPEVTRI